MPPHILYPPAPLEWYCNSTEGIFSDKNSAMSNWCEWFNEGNTKLAKTTQARNQDFMWGGANEAKADPTTEMYFLSSDPFI